MTTEFTIEEHFANKSPLVNDIYKRLMSKLNNFGPVVEEAKKSSIHLVNRSAFAGVATRKSYLLLNIKSAVPLDSPRFHKAEQISASRFHQEIKLARLEDIDQELIDWLMAAYELSA